MRINASFNIPVMALLEVGEEDLRAARAAGIRVGSDIQAYAAAEELAEWLITYWSSKASDYAIRRMVSDGEHERDLPELIQIQEVEDVP